MKTPFFIQLNGGRWAMVHHIVECDPRYTVRVVQGLHTERIAMPSIILVGLIIVVGLVISLSSRRGDFKSKEVSSRVCPACEDGHVTDNRGKVSRCPKCSGHGRVWY